MVGLLLTDREKYPKTGVCSVCSLALTEHSLVLTSASPPRAATNQLPK